MSTTIQRHFFLLLLSALTFLAIPANAINQSPPQYAVPCNVARGGFGRKSQSAPPATSDRGLATTIATNALESSLEQAVTSEWTVKEIMFGVLALAAGAASAAVMLLENGLLIDIVAWLCIVCGSTTVVLQKKLTDLESFRELNNEAREQVNVLKAANTRLSNQNKKMEQSTKKLQKAESALAEIGAAQGMTVDTLVKQVEEYKLIQENMKQSVKDKIRQTLVSVVINSDVDQDFVIDPEEIDVLCMRLGSIPNVQFNEQAFRKAIKKEGGSIMDFSKNHLSDDNVMAKEKIFVF